jgi:hypothetical protein
MEWSSCWSRDATSRCSLRAALARTSTGQRACRTTFSAIEPSSMLTGVGVRGGEDGAQHARFLAQTDRLLQRPEHIKPASLGLLASSARGRCPSPSERSGALRRPPVDGNDRNHRCPPHGQAQRPGRCDRQHCGRRAPGAPPASAGNDADRRENGRESTR